LTGLASGIAVGLLAYCLWGLSSVPFFSVAGFLLSTVILEIRAARFPKLGIFSLAPAFVLAAAMQGQAGVAGILLLSVLATRLAKGSRKPADFLMDIVPTLGAVSLVKVLGPNDFLLTGLSAMVAWAILITLLPGQLLGDLGSESTQEWSLARNTVWMSQLFIGPFAVGLALIAGAQPGAEMLMLFPALALQSLGRRAIDNPSDSEFRQARHQLRRAESQKKDLSEALQATERDKEATTRSLEFVQAFTRKAEDRDTLQGLWEAVNELLRERFSVRSTALFLPKDGKPEALFVDSPDQDRVKSAVLLQVTEPAVMRCWQDGRPLFTRKSPPGARLFEGDGACAAVGFGPGVLYLGKAESQPLQRAEKELLEVLAAYAGNRVTALLRTEEERRAYASSRQALGEVTQWSERLGGLLNGARLLAGTLEPAALMKTLEEMLTELFPCDHGCFLSLKEEQLAVMHGWPSIQEDDARALARHILKSGRSLLLQDVQETKFEAVCPEGRSFLGVMAESQFGVSGVLLIGSREFDQFNAEDQELLSVVGLMLAVTFRASETHWALKTSQEKLVQAGKLAAVGQLAGGVAHELNTPLGTVMMSLEGAARAAEKRPEKVGERLARAKAAVEHAQQITSNLLLFSRHESGDYKPFDFTAFVNRTMEGLKGRAFMKHVEMKTRLDPTDTVKGSEVELGQLIMQLAKNAAQACQKHENPLLQIRCGQSTDKVFFAIKDNGTGISEEVAKRMFEPFYTTRPVGHGTGLGLSLSREVALRHGGTLECVNRDPGETTFRLELPKA
jgi:signal transduction histidine kinase